MSSSKDRNVQFSTKRRLIMSGLFAMCQGSAAQGGGESRFTDLRTRS